MLSSGLFDLAVTRSTGSSSPSNIQAVTIWLDYPAWLVFWRLLGRTLRRGYTREVLWNGNRERLGPNLFSRDGILAWFFRTFWQRRRETPGKLAAYPYLQVLRFRHPDEAERWLRSQ